MRVKAYTDSLNLSSNNLEQHFRSENYIIEIVKSVGVFEPSRWIEEFGTKLTRNIIEAKILHTSSGLSLPIKRHNLTKDKQTLEMAGLHQYNEHSKLLNILLLELRERLQDEFISRLDVCIDFKEKIPTRVLKELKKNRKSFEYKNSTYFKTKSEKKKNYHTNILIYPKHKKDGLNEEIERLEFSFSNGYFKNQYRLKDLENIYIKIAKTIKRFTGLEVGFEVV